MAYRKQNYAPFCTETKESVLLCLENAPTAKNEWLSLVNTLENCGLNMQYINTPTIILDIANPLDPDNTNNQAIWILKYYLYKFRYLDDKPRINGGLQHLK